MLCRLHAGCSCKGQLELLVYITQLRLAQLIAEGRPLSKAAPIAPRPASGLLNGWLQTAVTPHLRPYWPQRTCHVINPPSSQQETAKVIKCCRPGPGQALRTYLTEVAVDHATSVLLSNHTCTCGCFAAPVCIFAAQAKRRGSPHKRRPARARR